MPRKKKSATIFEGQKTLFNYFRLGESYTSLILGIIVVIVGIVLLLSLAKTRTDTNPQTSSTSTIDDSASIIDNGNEIIISSEPESTENKPSMTVRAGEAYKVVENDDLWSIAERAYNDGYKWVEIARANNLSNPDQIEVGLSLSIPEIEQENVSFDTEKDTTKITENEYVVESGDNLWEISVRAYGDGYKWTELAKANELANPNLIHSGNKLKIPRK